jgi:hypothetical protein
MCSNTSLHINESSEQAGKTWLQLSGSFPQNLYCDGEIFSYCSLPSKDEIPTCMPSQHPEHGFKGFSLFLSLLQILTFQSVVFKAIALLCLNFYFEILIDSHVHIRTNTENPLSLYPIPPVVTFYKTHRQDIHNAWERFRKFPSYVVFKLYF